MQNKNGVIIFFSLLIFISLLIFFFYKKPNTKPIVEIQNNEVEEDIYSSNLVENVFYTSKDARGNEYIIRSKLGEIDYSNSNIIYLTNVSALIKLKNSNEITVTSDFGKYNSNNFDTIFSQNVIINYLDNKIVGQYLDFSLKRNTMIMSRQVVYTNLENILEADVIEMNIETKDTKIFMYENEKKVNVKSKNNNGDN